MVINKGLSNHFQISHTLSLGAFSPSSYHFGTTYVGSNQISPAEAYPVMLGDIDTSGSLNAQIINQLANRLRGKLVVQVCKLDFCLKEFQSFSSRPLCRGKPFIAS